MQPIRAFGARCPRAGAILMRGKSWVPQAPEARGDETLKCQPQESWQGKEFGEKLWCVCVEKQEKPKKHENAQKISSKTSPQFFAQFFTQISTWVLKFVAATSLWGMSGVRSSC